MGIPQLSARSPRLQLHQELIACPRYAVFVLWGGLLCPGELFREGVLEVFKVMLAEHALLPIFRDEVGNSSSTCNRELLTVCVVSKSSRSAKVGLQMN
jgi:hypothetical protein